MNDPALPGSTAVPGLNDPRRQPAVARPPERAEDWRILAVLGPYRLILVATLLALHRTGFAPDFFGRLQTSTFYYGCLGYSIAALLLLLAGVYRWPRLRMQAHAHLLTDVLTVGALVYGAGGISSGMGILLVAPVVAVSLVLRPRLAMVHAAVATLGIMGAEALSQFSAHAWSGSDYSQAGLLGLMFFASSLVANAVAQRARLSEAVAARVGSEYFSLSRLSENIIESMHTGVLVIDAEDRIRVANTAARRLLGEDLVAGATTAGALPELHTMLQRWRAGVSDAVPSLQVAGSGREVTVRLTRLGWGGSAQILVMLEDAAQLRQQAQQIKLAALGRLSAGIAHEIRNPLSAIMQAGQLLAESSAVDGENRRLLAMIQRHAARIERIVGDVLELSRRDPSRQESLPLHAWLQQTVALYDESHPHEPRPVALADVPRDLTVRFDPMHLQQVLFNLWDNSFENGARAGRTVRVALRAERSRDGEATLLDVTDDGPGIPRELHERIFEPFFTTTPSGTGLGLFLCRELCEYNHARLSHVPTPRGATFRIRFAPAPERTARTDQATTT